MYFSCIFVFLFFLCCHSYPGAFLLSDSGFIFVYLSFPYLLIPGFLPVFLGFLCKMFFFLLQTIPPGALNKLPGVWVNIYTLVIGLISISIYMYIYCLYIYYIYIHKQLGYFRVCKYLYIHIYTYSFCYITKKVQGY